MMKNMKTLVWLAAVVLAVTACGSDDGAAGSSDDAAEALVEQILEQAGDGDINIDTDDGGITLTDEDGSVEISTDDDEMTMTVDGDEGGFSATLGGDLPADFPFPLPDNFEVGSSMQIDDEPGTTYSAVINVAPEEYDSVKAMYESWLESEGFTLDAFEMEGDDGTKGVFIDGERDDVDAFISISLEEVANDDAGNLIYETAISLTWAPLG